MRNIPVRPFFMLRHAQSEANAAGIYSGQMDTPLSELGWAQAERVSYIIDKLPQKPRIVIHSHLSRARETARLAARNLDIEFIERKDWAEHHLGDWQGAPHHEVIAMRESGIDPPNGESNAAFRARIINALEITLAAYEYPLIVCHGGCFRAIREHFGLSAREKNKNQQTSSGTNCILHEFIPTNNRNFPWEVYCYELENGTRTLSER